MNANQILQRGGGIARDTLRLAEQLGRRAVRETFGMVKVARHLGRSPKPGMDDVTLARKVETEIFRAPGTPKSTVNVNVVDGVVWLRGEVKRPEQIRRLETRARAIPEVREVENLLHLTKTPAPTRADTPRRQQRTRSSTRRPTPRARTTGRVSNDRTSAIATEGEPTPSEHARQGEGRSPAPLGASGAQEPSRSGPLGASGGAQEPSPSGPLGASGGAQEPSPSGPLGASGGAQEPASPGGRPEPAEPADSPHAGGAAEEGPPPSNGSLRE